VVKVAKAKKNVKAEHEEHLKVNCMIKEQGHKSNFQRGMLAFEGDTIAFQFINNNKSKNKKVSCKLDEIEEISVAGHFLDKQIVIQTKEEKFCFRQVLSGKADEFIARVQEQKKDCK